MQTNNKEYLALYEAALTLAENQKIEESLQTYTELLLKPELSSEIKSMAYNDIGAISFSIGYLQKAEEYFNKSIFSDVLYEEAHKNLMHLNSGKIDTRYRFSIIISTYNRCDDLKKCVESIRKNSYFPVEIIIIADPCQDGSVEYILSEKESPDVVALINSEHIGHSKSVNRGVRAATGDYVCYLNDDVVVMPGWDLALVVTIDADDSIGCGIPLVVYGNGTVQSPGQNNPYRSKIFDWIGKVKFVDTESVNKECIENFTEFHTPRECDYGYFPVMKRDCFTKVGLIDEAFTHYFIDPDQGYRIQNIGLRSVYCPTSVFVHYELSKNDPVGLNKKCYPDFVKFVNKWGIYNVNL